MSDVGTLTVRTNTEGHLAGACLKSGPVYANTSDLECVWLWGGSGDGERGGGDLSLKCLL